MSVTMTYVGLDVHARSIHAAAIDMQNGELRRARFGGGSDEVVAWLEALPRPLRSCYEAGPTGVTGVASPLVVYDRVEFFSAAAVEREP